MATGTVPSNAAASPEAASHPYADLVEDHVRRTQAYLRSCDIAGAVITIVVFVLGYLMAMALIDHWIWPGGLGRGGRLLACVTMLVLVGVYSWRTLVPHLLRRINPVYAADRLERAQPSLMNSLVNLLMLRSQDRQISDGVMRGLERQAATGIEHLPAEAAVDRRKLLRTAYVLVGVLLFCALYVVFSPKSPFISAARILIPWADISAVTRVRIEKVRPGSEDVYRGEPVTVTAEIRGLREDEPVTLRYASVDGQTDNQSVVMFRREGQTTHSCQLPPDTAGMQRDLDYQIVAGDTKSAEFRLHVVPAPTIQIESIEYRYPAYTGMPPLTVERLGDIKGLEGTQVVIRAKSSQPIGTASLQLSGIRDTTLPMQSRGELAARVELPLKLVNVQGGRDPQYTSYKLDVTNAKGNHNREPASYRIEVTPDLPPQVDVFEPKERDIQLPADKELSIEVRARDADFALADVRLLATRKGERLLDESLVKDRKIRLDQPVRTAYRFVPARHGLKAGDEVLFRVSAIDNKRPQPNRQLTPEYRIAIVAPETPPMQKREPNQQEDMQREGTPNQQGDPVAAGKGAKGEQGKAGEKQSSQDPSNKNPSGGDEQSQRADNSGASRKGEKGEKGAKSEKGEKSGKGEKGEGNEAGSGSESQGSEGSEQQKDGALKSKDEGSGGASDSASAGSDPIDDGEAVQRIVKHLEQQGKKPEDQQQSGDSSGGKSGDESQVASADKQDNQQNSKQKGSQKPEKQDSQNQPKDNQQGSQQPDSKDQGGSSSGEKSSDQKQGEKQDGDKSGQKKDGQQQGSQKSQSGQQQGQSQSGGGGKSEQQGSQSGSQGNSSGQGQKSSSEQSSGDQQGSSKEGEWKKDSSSSSTQGQKGSSSSDSKQPGSGDRQTQQAESSPSNKSSSGASQADSKQQGSRPGDQTVQKQPGEGTPNQQAKGEKQSGSQSAQDKSASAQQRTGDKAQGQASGDQQSGEKPKGDGNKDGGKNDDIAKKLEQLADKIGYKFNKKNPGQQPEGGKKPDDQVASSDPTQKQQGQKQSGQKQTGPQKSGEGQSSEQQKGENAEGAKTKGMNPGERDPQSQPQKQPNASDGGKPQSGGAQGRQEEDGSSGEGNRPDDKAKDIAQKSGESSDNRPGGDPKDKPQDKARAPGKTPAKGQQAASDSKTSEEDSKAPEKQRPSDTGSDQGGERAGKGQEGMGQASSGAGGGSAGKSQAADDGGSRSQQSGPGDQSNRAGNQQQTDRATGKAGQQAGDARSGRPENDKRQSGDSQRSPEDGQPSEPNPQAPQGMQPGQGQQVEGQPSQQASGSGGDPATGKSGPSSSKPSGTVVPGSEQANLEYSKRATDLTLSYLQDQLAKGRIDDGLRKRLGWSEEEFQSLLKRMQSMRDRGADAAAKPEDKQAYEQWLKSLGLRPSTGAVRTGKVESKPLANSRDDAPVSVPRDLREQHEAFRQGLLEKSR
ncbi:MAG: hypothetical protein K8T91_10610 [Planctomycetes bacterium]|nr:hypothetical protein [Planctomycetota bacterium]